MNSRVLTLRTTVALLLAGAARLTLWAAESEHDPAQAVENLAVHPELSAQLFASEPMMRSPSCIDVDARGRVWVGEVMNYRGHKGKRPEGDRILILEDTDHDAKADKVTVFHQGPDVDSLHGLCVLGNRVLVSAGDEVFWLFDDDGDGKSDRKQVLFTKVGGTQHDHGIHAFHFGPDGRLYFNFGNAAKQLCDAQGELIHDVHGIPCTNQNNRPLQQGMVFRCELDGSRVEVLGWNFRNNWEVAVDSFGTLWQSDNDDDGNKGVRINYVMEFGNYGYTDEMTGAGWRVPRVGWEGEIPLRHWHLNDPGVVPNLLQTGAGSPTGMQVYEGLLLPPTFFGHPIHCDAGPNVVRAYRARPAGAGYSASILNVLDGSEKDRWFRPSDVCVAPDGSLIVADWYDPGVGGHGMGDLERGRLFRVTTKRAVRYQPAPVKTDTVEGAVKALQSPNEEARYLGWIALCRFGEKAQPALKVLFQNRNALPQHRARALWALVQMPAIQSEPLLQEALDDNNDNLRITALRAGRRIYANQPDRLRALVSRAARDVEACVRREAAIALRFDQSEVAARLWWLIAERADVRDRWMIEALGIGNDLVAETRAVTVAANPEWRKAVPAAVQAALTWRGRSLSDVAAIRDLVLKESLPQGAPGRLAMLRALQMLQPKYSEEVAAAALEVFRKADAETALASLALVSRAELERDPVGRERLDNLLKPLIGKPAFVALVEKLNLPGFDRELLEFLVANPSAPEAGSAAKLLSADREKCVRAIVEGKPSEASVLVAALGRVGGREGAPALADAFWKAKVPAVRTAVVEALAMGGDGARNLLRWASEGKLPEEFKTAAALGLSRSTDGGIRAEAAKVLPLPAAQGLQDFPAMAELLKLQGDAAKGPELFAKAGCVACHRVKEQYVDFGPDLSLIGSKLSREGLFTAVLYPSAAIEHSFTGVQISTKDGQTQVGYVVSETDAETTLRVAGGASVPVRKEQIAGRVEMKESLMPPGLAGAIGPQGLADLVAWMQSLK